MEIGWRVGGVFRNRPDGQKISKNGRGLPLARTSKPLILLHPRSAICSLRETTLLPSVHLRKLWL